MFATVFPSNCRLCQAPLVEISRLPVCAECLEQIAPIRGRFCRVCGERLFSAHLETGAGEAQCGHCRRVEKPFLRAAAYGSYDGGLRDLIHLLKYEQVRPVARVLGRMLAEAVQGLGKDFAGQRPLVVPVPLHAGKLRQRGFNQAEEIVRAALKHGQAGPLRMSTGVLERRRATESQTGLTRHQRRENVRGAFVVRAPGEIAGQDILLVDDVFTTGTTVTECAQVLRRAGAARVFVATVARVLKAEPAYASNQERGPEETRQEPAMRASA